MLVVIVQTKGPRSRVTCLVISAVWPSALLANVVHQQKREREWGDFSTEYPTQKRAHKDSPSPTHPLTHRQTHFRLVAPRWHLISAGSRGGSFRVGSHGMTHTDTPLHFCFPIGRGGSNTWNGAGCFCPEPAALGNSPPRRPALPRH